jgi:hypothetical protein
MHVFSVILYILLGLVQCALLTTGALIVLGTAFDAAPIDHDAADLGTAIAVGALVALLATAIPFLRVVGKGRDFLADEGQIQLPEFGSTVFWFFVPLANLYVPWKRLATIRNSLSHYLRTNDFEEHGAGRGATIILTVLYFLGGLAYTTDDLAGLSQDERAGAALLALIGLAIFVLAFLYSTFWLISFDGKPAKARGIYAASPDGIRRFAD